MTARRPPLALSRRELAVSAMGVVLLLPGCGIGGDSGVCTGATEGSGEYVTSQLFFEPELVEAVYTDHPEYSPRGVPDTANADDKVLGANDPAPYTFAAERQADGALLAWKTLIVRASLSDELCVAPESAR